MFLVQLLQMSLFPYHLWSDFFVGSEEARNTPHEVDFLEKAIPLHSNDRILDLCCGNGRHAIELSAHGFDVTGLNIMPEMLKRAASAAKKRGVELALVEGDMQDFNASEKYDVIINMFQSFGYADRKEGDEKVLRNIHAALKPNGKLLLDARNPNYVFAKIIEGGAAQYNDSYKNQNGAMEITESIDQDRKWRLSFKFRQHGKKDMDRQLSVRLYTLDELIQMLIVAGFSIVHVWGDYEAKSFDDQKSHRLIVLAQKSINHG